MWTDLDLMWSISWVGVTDAIMWITSNVDNDSNCCRLREEQSSSDVIF